ncbi:S8 family serine peptidase [Chelativorans sp. J32]|uniref:S8 family serine peptidase n=1 Tax=Chelativorans sp. J32 TaxID=935840 RepID=UPI0004AEF951|nr:S8 family serine peptidase [Chelativorans sp. J32]
MLIAIIDSGIDANHPEFLGRVSPLSFSFLRGEDADDIFDDDGHGTHVTGILGAARNGIGNMGVAYAAELMALKAIGSGLLTNCGHFGHRRIMRLFMLQAEAPK